MIRNRSILAGLLISALALFAQAQDTAPISQIPPAAPGSRPPTVSVKESKEHLLKRVDANYPPIATAAHVSGDVVIGAEISTEGNVTIVVPMSGPEMLKGAAAEAVKQYKYTPFVINGAPAVVRTAVVVKFVLGRSKSVE